LSVIVFRFLLLSTTRDPHAQADVNARDEDGNTPLHQAVLNEEVAFVKRLLDVKADVGQKNEEGESARDINPNWFDEQALGGVAAAAADGE
jgi:ankyrin repeat protein